MELIYKRPKIYHNYILGYLIFLCKLKRNHNTRFITEFQLNFLLTFLKVPFKF